MTFGKALDTFFSHPDGAIYRAYTAGHYPAIFIRRSEKETPYLVAKNAYGDVLPYTPTNQDLFANDWEFSLSR